MGSTGFNSYLSAIRHQPETGLARRAWATVQMMRARLRYGIGPRYFCVFRLADKPAPQWRDYVIEFSDFKRRLAALTPRDVHAIADDKVRFYLFCREHGLATIPIEFLVLRPGAERYPGIPTVTSAEEFQAALDRCSGRLFFKPVDGVWGEGAFGVQRLADGCEFDGRRGSLDEAFRFVSSRLDGTRGYMAQPRVANHPAFRAVSSSEGLATVRIITCRRGDGMRVIYAVMKLTVGKNLTDNFHHGANGNLVARVDLESGRLGAAVGAVRTDWPLMADFVNHPDTGIPIAGFCVPHWAATIQLVTNAHRALPQLRITGWDVAITAEGPLIVETNPRFGFDIVQIANDRGIRREVMDAVGMP
jgi:hypothetical protein